NTNHIVDQKIVMAHVYGHADFFKNNAWFANTDRNMMAVMANHGTKIRRYMERYGQNKVEEFIDRVLSIENLIDVGMLFETQELKRQREERLVSAKEEIAAAEDDRSNALKSFMRAKEKTGKKTEPAPEASDLRDKKINAPRDVMFYLLENAPLEEWESDVLGILRDEAYYFLPQRLTKIMNEGWASYWHSHIMTTRALKSSEIIDYADHHAGVMAMSKQNINPYKIGIELYRDIEYRWNTGRFGKEYNECEDMHSKLHWNKDLGLGRQKLFEVRKTHNDVSFIDEFFTPEFCERQQLFTYKYNPRTGRNEIETRDFMEIKNKLLTQLSNFGSPVIEVESGNYQNRGELLLRHVHRGVDLDFGYASDTLRNLFALWKRPVNITSRQEEQNITLSFDGKEFKQSK
ncbi:MAG: SpoVR family protein, partial [Bacteriovorax sp.]